VEASDEQCQSQNLSVIRLRAQNSGVTALSQVRFEYYVTLPLTDSLVVDPYYLPNASTKSQRLGGGLWRVDVELPSLPVGTWPNSSGASIGLHTPNWGIFKKEDDFSAPTGCAFETNDRIVTRVADTPVWGRLPGAVAGDLRIVAVRPGSELGAPWVRLRNVGGQPISTQGWYALQSYEGDTLALPDTLLPVGGDLLLQGDSWSGADSIGEFALLYESNIRSYVAWGEAGSLAVHAQQTGKWTLPIDYLSTQKNVFAMIKSYKAGSEFWVAPNREGVQSPDWLLYYPEEQALAQQGEYPPALILTPTNGVQVYAPGEELVHLTWVPVTGVDSTHIRIQERNTQNLVMDTIVTGRSMALPLPAGEYEWSATVGSTETSKDLFDVIRVITYDDKDRVDLKLSSPPGRRDTYLLDMGWGKEIANTDPDDPDRMWDKPHPFIREQTKNQPDDEESWRCWAISIHIMNRFYGGTLTQDEIKLHGKRDYITNTLRPYFQQQAEGGGDLNEIYDTYAWAMGIQQSDLSINYSATTILNDIITRLDLNEPVYFINSNGGYHAMVVDAYIKDVHGKYWLHLQNIDNNGGAQWWGIDYWPGSIWQIIMPKTGVTIQPRLFDPLIAQDQDGDGIQDFDELYRFGSLPQKMDSDDDGIPDRREIESCALQHEYISGKTTIANCDPDGDGLNGWLDDDSDGGGILDSDEDKNKDGRISSTEGNPWIYNDDHQSISISTFPANFTLYAMNKLWMNDRSQCRDFWSSHGWVMCDVAAAHPLDDGYSIVIGVKVMVSMFSTLGHNLLRSGSSAVNHITKGRIDLHGNASAGELKVLEPQEQDLYDLTYQPKSYLFSPFYAGSQNVVVRNGETLSLSSGSYSSIKVESGGTLIWPDGEVYTSDLQLESGATISKPTTGNTTVLHLNGRCIWRSQYLETDLKEVAKHFVLVQHAQNALNMEGRWAGTILAPNSWVTLGQADKSIWGRVLGYNIELHQDAIFQNVDLIYNGTPLLEGQYEWSYN